MYYAKLLIAPSSYWGATKEERAKVCNGAGPAGRGWLVPDTMWGLSITEAANIHDWMYNEGKDKKEADETFYKNCLLIINKKGGWLAPLRRYRAHSYYLAVKYFGASSFSS